ncbi:hypothetical protein CPC08DRAFT_724649 [Agrocybe pediades]|nr:hypothetical protein CPC08DRAFT_724649 [Agrocybe pediades]
MPQALPASRSSDNNPCRARVAYSGDVEASARPGEITCTVQNEASQVVASQAAGRVVDVDATLATVNSSDFDGTAVNFLVVSLTWICGKAAQTVNASIFPASKWCYYLFHCATDEGIEYHSQREYLVRWEAALVSIARYWKDTQSITTSLLLVSALAILQLDGALNDKAICTGIAASILLALASILSSFVYLLSKQRFISRWRRSETPDPSFWRCVGMPLDFAIWSFFFFIGTVFVLIYKRMLPASQASEPTLDQGMINSPETLGAIFVTVLLLLSIYVIFVQGHFGVGNFVILGIYFRFSYPTSPGVSGSV